MKVEIHLLRFYVQVWDPETETNREEPITLTKEQLRSAGLLEMSSKEVIDRTISGAERSASPHSRRPAYCRGPRLPHLCRHTPLARSTDSRRRR